MTSSEGIWLLALPGPKPDQKSELFMRDRNRQHSAVSLINDIVRTSAVNGDAVRVINSNGFHAPKSEDTKFGSPPNARWDAFLLQDAMKMGHAAKGRKGQWNEPSA